MKVLVTGGTGFLGRHLVWRLSNDGHHILFTGRSEEKARLVRKIHPTARWIAIDHASKKSTTALMDASKGVDAIIHCAALSSPWGSTQDFHCANVRSTEDVLMAAQENRVKRIVHISTPSIYFSFRDQFNIRESDPLPDPVNEYSRTKRIAEELVCAASFCERVILRPRALFGPWDDTLMPRLIRVMKRSAFPIMRNGDAWVDLCYIDNAVDAVMLALEKPLPSSLCVYNVSNGQPIRLAELIPMVAAELKLPLRVRKVPFPILRNIARLLEFASNIGLTNEPLMTQYSAGVLAFSQTLDISRIQKELGYRPKISVFEGIARYSEWYSRVNP